MEKLHQHFPSSQSNEPAIPSTQKPSRWIGIVAITLFAILGGFSGCPWYMWIILIILALLTFGGILKWVQMALGAILLIWGTPKFDGNDNMNSQTYQSSETQSSRERKEIEGKIELIQSLQSQYDRAERMGTPDYELQRISNEAWAIKQTLEQKNLTREQRDRLSRMFSL